MLKIKNVAKNSIGSEIGLKCGDCITRFNDKDANDLFDYIYFDSQNDFSMTAVCNGEETEFDIEKFDDESLGLEFDYNFKTVSCKNNCIFCFVNQLPKGMRKTLYVKDDDWRQSLTHGNYVTLTNVDEASMSRIVEMRMSPLYISVHTTDRELRSKMLQNKHCGDILEKLRHLSDNNIKMHCQIVLVKGLNDGRNLEKTLDDLCSVDNILSIAIVPVGLTRYRQNLHDVQAIDLDAAREAIVIADRYNGDKQILCSDEFYVKAQLPVKPFSEYGDFSQIENGVGLIAKFEHEFYNAKIPKKHTPKKVTLITGYSSFDVIEKAARCVMKNFKDIHVNLKEIRNDFFGESITVTGLITGGDIINQLQGEDIGEYLIVPKVTLREFDTVFLDDVSIKDVEERLGIKIKISDTSGQGFWDAIIK